MSFFDLDPVASANIIDQARANPIQAGDLNAGAFEGMGTGIMSGLKSAYYRDIFNAADAKDNEAKKQEMIKNIQDSQVDPASVGLAGQVLFSLTETLGSVGANVLGGSIVPTQLAMDVGTSYTKSQIPLNIAKGMDPATAESVAKLEGAGIGLGVVAPASIAGSIATRVASGAAINTAMGVAQRGMISSELNKAGYTNLADQYKPFEAGSLLADIAIGGFFGGVSGHGSKPGETAAKVKPSDLDAALTMKKAAHVEIDTLPGIPGSPEARDAHVESVNKALADLLGDKPVDVGIKPTLVDFVENPAQDAIRREIGDAVSVHLDLPSLEANLSGIEGRTPINVPGAILGAESSIKIENAYQPVRWALVDAANIEATMSKADNQFRDRQRAASAAQVSKIANQPDFNLLATSPIMDFGAPTLTNEGLIVGGNGRFAGLSKAYDQGSHEGYSKPLATNLEKYGIDPTAAAGMKKPVLVRILQKHIDVQRAAMASNEGAGLKMSALEQAKVDAVRLGNIAGLQVSENGEILSGPNHDFIRQWSMAMPDTERASLVDKAGHLSQEGKTRLRNAVLHRAYGDSATLERVVESADPGARNVVAALVKTAANVAEAKAAIDAGNLYPADISADISSAVETLDRVRSQGMKISDYLNQGEMFGSELSPEARKIMQFMGENLRSAKAMSEMLNSYYERLQQAGDPKQGDMLGGSAPSKMALLDAAIADTGKNLTPGMAELPFEGEIQKPKDAIGSELMGRVNNDFKKLTKEYSKLEDSKGGQVLNTDVARELSPGYLKDRTRSADVHEAASAFVKKLYAEKLAKPTPKGKDPIVAFTAGGTGAGKTTGLELMGETGSRFEIIYDTNMNTLESADKKIQQALDAGRAVTILYTYRDPQEAFQNGALTRATRQEKQFGTGRTVPIDEHIKTHTGSREVMDQLAAKYANNDSVNMIAVDNSRGKGNEAIVPLENIPKIEQNGLKEKLNETLRTELQAGRISEATAKGFAEPGRAQGAQSEIRQGSAIQPGEHAAGSGQPAAAGSDPYSVDQLIFERPDLTIPDQDGNPILASQALAQADAEIATAQRDSKAFDAAAACALRG